MKRTNWFDRKFPLIEDNGVLPCIIERLDGTAARLAEKIARINADNFAQSPDGKWSIKKEIGHLIDLEPLWFERAMQILDAQSNLKAADLTNRKTHEAPHDKRDTADLLGEFRQARQQFVQVLQQTNEADLDKAAIHPRLGTPMKLVDLAYFVAEHDDHHLAQISFLGGG